MAAPMCRSVWSNFRPPSVKWRCFCTNSRKRCKAVLAGDKACTASPFQQNIHARQDQAARSILVRLSGKTSESSLLQYCSSHGKVQHCFTYSQQPHGRYALVEFKTSEAIDLILGRTYASRDNGQAQSRFLSFSGSAGQAGQADAPRLTDLNKDSNPTDLYQKLAGADSVSEQLDVLTAEQELRDPEVRLRFLACSLIREAFGRLLPGCQLRLFGSSVNGFGRRSCDVDMFLERNTAHGVIPLRKGKGKYKLGYDRPSAESERVAAQTTLLTLASYLEKQVPHCISVARILQAKCPLIKFRHLATGLSCDLTADNSIAVKSSELLYILGQLDPRVRPLVFAVRHWARYHGITHHNPGHWITNFPLTLLVVFFLQTRPTPVLPSFDHLRSLAEDVDRCFIDGLDCTITGDLSKVAPSENTETTADLLQEFFEFCTTFNFEFRRLSVRAGEAGPKPDHAAPLYMENPFQTELNMCRNVSQALVQDVQRQAQRALQLMDKPAFWKPAAGSDGDDGNVLPWGAMALFGPPRGRRSGQRSLWLDNNIGPVLRGLSRKGQGQSQDSGTPHQTNFTAPARPSSDDDSSAAWTLRSDNAATALDASLAPDHTSEVGGAPGGCSADAVPGGDQTGRRNGAESRQPASLAGEARTAVPDEPQTDRKLAVPKLQITISNVRNRLLNGRAQEKSPQWNQHLASLQRRFSQLCSV